MLRTCSECGSRTDQEGAWCPSCGSQLPQRASDSAGGIGSGVASPRTLYLVTVGGGLVFFGGLTTYLSALGTSPGDASAAMMVFLVALLGWVASLISMYIDLRDLHATPLGVSAGMWVLGAILVYVVVVPLYALLRREAVLGDAER